MTYLVDANVLSEATKPAPDSKAIEWLRRNDPTWDRVLRTYLFTEAPITEVEAEAEATGAADAAASGAAPGDLTRSPAR